MKLSRLGICGVLSLLSYLAMVVFSPLAYPGYDWMRMAVSELSAVGAPSRELAAQLNSLFGPCGIVSVMEVCSRSRAAGRGSCGWACTALRQWSGCARSGIPAFRVSRRPII